MSLVQRLIWVICVFLWLGYTPPISAQEIAEIDQKQLWELVKFVESTFADGVRILHKGKLVLDWKSGTCDSLFYGTASMSKSWLGLVIGIMVDKGVIKSEEDQVCDYLPEWEKGCENQVTIKNLLNMAAGFNRRGGRGILSAEDAHTYALQSVPDTLPGIRFGYSNVSVQLLGMVVEKLSGKDCNQYFDEVLFKPLGMDSTTLRKDQTNKNYVVYGGARTTLEDASQIGLLMLNKGVHQGKRLISESWITKSTTASDLANYYGYLWWIDNFSADKNFAATGDLGQMTIVFPGLDLVFLRRQKCNTTDFRNMEWMGPKFLKLVASIIKKKD